MNLFALGKGPFSGSRYSENQETQNCQKYSFISSIMFNCISNQKHKIKEIEFLTFTWNIALLLWTLFLLAWEQVSHVALYFLIISNVYLLINKEYFRRIHSSSVCKLRNDLFSHTWVDVVLRIVKIVTSATEETVHPFNY